MDDPFAVQVVQSLQHLPANHLDLRLGQAPVQLCREVKQHREKVSSSPEQQEGPGDPAERGKATCPRVRAAGGDGNQLLKVIYSLSQHLQQSFHILEMLAQRSLLGMRGMRREGEPEMPGMGSELQIP